MTQIRTQWKGRDVACEFEQPQHSHGDFHRCGRLAVDGNAVATVWFQDEPLMWRMVTLDGDRQYENVSAREAILQLMLEEAA